MALEANSACGLLHKLHFFSNLQPIRTQNCTIFPNFWHTMPIKEFGGWASQKMLLKLIQISRMIGCIILTRKCNHCALHLFSDLFCHLTIHSCVTRKYYVKINQFNCRKILKMKSVLYGQCVYCVMFFYFFHINQGPDHVQVNWKHKSIGNISQLETRPLIG